MDGLTLTRLFGGCFTRLLLAAPLGQCCLLMLLRLTASGCELPFAPCVPKDSSDLERTFDNLLLSTPQYRDSGNAHTLPNSESQSSPKIEYTVRIDARSDVFNYFEMFYNSQRRHSTAAGLSPVEFEQRHSQRLKSV